MLTMLPKLMLALLWTASILSLLSGARVSSLTHGDAKPKMTSAKGGEERLVVTNPAPVFIELPPTLKAPVMPKLGGENDAAKLECVPDAICYGDSDCGTDSAESYCAGSELVGTCKCSACLSGVPCDNDGDCGGLRYACPKSIGLCDCRLGFKKNGFHTYPRTLSAFCDRKRCDGRADACFGLPCRSGRCVCS